MNFFESELRKLFEDGQLITDSASRETQTRKKEKNAYER